MAKSPSAKRPLVEIKDPHGAPFLYFDAAPNAGTYQGIICITLAAARRLAKGPNVEVDVVAVGHLRCSMRAARELRQAIDQALLLAAPEPEHKS
ncbi:MAG: hypothetical protein R3D27_09855 [Hyphomicrobiaceae bacterium]